MKCSFAIALLSALILFSAATVAEASPIALDSPLSLWSVARVSADYVDFINDQQTGRPESDIVGNASSAGFFTYFDAGGALSPATMYFRVRLGSDLPQPGEFNSVMFVMIDADHNGSVDLLVGPDNKSHINEIRIWDPGSGANTYPDNTSIKSPLNQVRYAETPANYLFAPVTGMLPSGADTDIDGDGKTDYYLTFSVPFSDIAGELSRLRHIDITQDTPLSFVVITSVEDNAINEDAGGLDGWPVNQPWPFDSNREDSSAVPEPATLGLAGAAIAALVVAQPRGKASRKS